MKRITRFLGGLNNGLTRFYLFIGTLCVVLVVVGIVWTCNGVKNSSLSLGVNEKIDCTPNIVDRMRAIGQWEFLTVTDEELIDTVRKGFFSDDELKNMATGFSVFPALKTRTVAKGSLSPEDLSVNTPFTVVVCPIILPAMISKVAITNKVFFIVLLQKS